MSVGPRPVLPPSVWWGDADSVQRLGYWQQRREAEGLDLITHVCNVAANGVPLSEKERLAGVTYVDLFMLDAPGDVAGSDIWRRNMNELRVAVAFVEEVVQLGGRVLVNCHMGQNRSGAVLLAWLLMHKEGFTLNGAVGHLRRIEPDALNNDSLRKLAESVASTSATSLLHTSCLPSELPAARDWKSQAATWGVSSNIAPKHVEEEEEEVEGDLGDLFG